MSKIMTKYEIKVTEYDPTGYYYPTYSSVQIVIAASLEEAKDEAIKRTPMEHSSGWKQKTTIITSEDIVVEDFETDKSEKIKNKMNMNSHITLEDIKQSYKWGKKNLGEGQFNIDDEQIKWLINQADTLIKISDRWIELEIHKPDEIDGFYGDVQDLLAELEESENEK